LFIQKELKHQRQKKPGLKNKEYMKLAAIEWNKYKEKNGIVTGGSKTAKKPAKGKTASKKAPAKKAPAKGKGKKVESDEEDEE